jgi:hypothetical protein
MSIPKTVVRLRELARALPRPGCHWEERPRFDPPAKAQSVAQLERAAGFALPDDLRAFFEETESIVAMSIHNGYWLGGVEQLIRSAKQAGIPLAACSAGN